MSYNYPYRLILNIPRYTPETGTTSISAVLVHGNVPTFAERRRRLINSLRQRLLYSTNVLLHSVLTVSMYYSRLWSTWYDLLYI